MFLHFIPADFFKSPPPSRIPGPSLTHPWPLSKSKFNLKSDRVNLVAPASPIDCLLYLPNVRAIQYKLGPERLTRLGNSNVLRLPVPFPLHSYLYKPFFLDILRPPPLPTLYTFLLSPLPGLHKHYYQIHTFIILLPHLPYLSFNFYINAPLISSLCTYLKYTLSPYIHTCILFLKYIPLILLLLEIHSFNPPPS